MFPGSPPGKSKDFEALPWARQSVLRQAGKSGRRTPRLRAAQRERLALTGASAHSHAELKRPHSSLHRLPSSPGLVSFIFQIMNEQFSPAQPLPTASAGPPSPTRSISSVSCILGDHLRTSFPAPRGNHFLHRHSIFIKGFPQLSSNLGCRPIS